MEFKSDETKKYDLAVCLGLLRLAIESFSIFKNQQEDVTDDGGAMETAVRYLLNM